MKYVRIIFVPCILSFLCFCLAASAFAKQNFPAHTIPSFQYETQYYREYYPKLSISFFNVGQGDCTLIVLPNGKTILIDGGPHEAGELVVRKLEEKKIGGIDLVISTHPDIDHIGGLITVLQQVPVRMVLDSGKRYNSYTYLEYIRTIRKRHIPFIFAKEGQYLPIDPNVVIQVLNNGKAKEQNNESSIVLKLRYKHADFLLMGDADTATEEMIIKRYDTHADVLKVGHHGSYTSTSKAFLHAVNPQFAVISYDKHNPYGHPHQVVRKRLKKHGIRVFSTAKHGDVEFVTDGKNLEIEGELLFPLLK
ncbi:ComEC/Rec2 family competence protein [Bacillus sp. 165]|uniref:ComEC/Rec2 family competence protein n=1 Tax=Bacillus sp. 165 TaxID=1529117 RepID=UPI001ADA84B2|nr:ComEC/Rec2 family competence protein [Bacillus sp. 165]MBO9129836.1 MBL fold metallo-hydrolase [Bacillus sp. 165]